MNNPGWGLLPEEITERLRARNWENRSVLKARLRSDKPFPIRIGLKPPPGQQALAQLDHFRRFVEAWRNFTHPSFVEWETRHYRQIAPQTVPVRLVLPDIKSLAAVLGPSEQQALSCWQMRFSQILAEPFAREADRQESLFLVLIDHLEDLERYSDQDLELLVNLIPQLQSGMGNGGFLRALPVFYVDTKFIEQNFRIIERMMDVLYAGAIRDTGGLLSWLDCRENPKGWLMVRPLCKRTQEALGGLPLLQLSVDTLLDFKLPARHILVVENMQSGLALPSLDNTIAVFGGGKNISWLSAPWLASKKVAYWGDIDSEGLGILGDARSKLASITALMMDEETIHRHRARMVNESVTLQYEPAGLAAEELILFRKLKNAEYGKTRLEQERIAPEDINLALKAWATRHG